MKLLNTALKIDKNNKAGLRLLENIKRLKKGEIFLDGDEIDTDNKAEDLLMEGKYAEALKLYLKDADVMSNSANRKIRVAQCYWKLNDTINAFKCFSMAYEQDSTDLSTVLFSITIAEELRGLAHPTKYFYARALELYPENVFILERSSDYYMRTQNFLQCIKVGELADKKYPKNKTIGLNTALAALLMRNCQVALSKYGYLNLMYPSDTLMALLAQAYLSCSDENPQSPEFKKGFELVHTAYGINPGNTIVGGVYQRYLAAITLAASIDKNKALSPAPNANNLNKDNLNTTQAIQIPRVVILFSDRTTTISSRGSQNIFTHRFKNGSELEIVYSADGSTSTSERFHNGLGPPKNAGLRTTRQCIDLVFNNKKLSTPVALNFLNTELQYNKSLKSHDSKAVFENKQLIQYIGILINYLEKK